MKCKTVTFKAFSKKERKIKFYDYYDIQDIKCNISFKIFLSLAASLRHATAPSLPATVTAPHAGPSRRGGGPHSLTHHGQDERSREHQGDEGK